MLILLLRTVDFHARGVIKIDENEGLDCLKIVENHGSGVLEWLGMLLECLWRVWAMIFRQVTSWRLDWCSIGKSSAKLVQDAAMLDYVGAKTAT